VEYSLNGFSTAGAQAGSVTNIGTDQSGTFQSWSGLPYTVDLYAQGSLQNIAAGATVTFRLYFWDFGTFEDKGLGEWQGDNQPATNDLTLTGSLAPTSLPIQNASFRMAARRLTAPRPGGPRAILPRLGESPRTRNSR